jgi:hypothetical protein
VSATTRAPRVGEDWTTARCRNAHRPWGGCCFCGLPIRPGQGCYAVQGGERAHYGCAPGLGRRVLPAGAFWFGKDELQGGTMQVVAMLDKETGLTVSMGVVKRVHYKDRVYAAMVSLEEMADETAEIVVHVLECVRDEDDDGDDAFDYRPITDQNHFAIASVLVNEALVGGDANAVDVFFEER